MLLAFVLWYLANGLDDLFIAAAWLARQWHTRKGQSTDHGALRWPTPDQLFHSPERRIAIFVPAWREDAVIEQMLRRNIAALQYESYRIFVGAYPNDDATQRAVLRAANAHPGRVELVVCREPGPTSKADCLNTVWEQMAIYEEFHGRFDLIVMHDAEDILDPDELRWKNWFSYDFDMVQTPVLPLATPISQWIHGLYCDDFAEFHTKDLAVRHWLGGFVPSCGVATAFKRRELERLADGNEGGLPFLPGALTEDYEIGYRLHRNGARQVFVPLPARAGGRYTATREYFPMGFWAAVRQRTRWNTGIIFQGWQRHGWGHSFTSIYWFWRDRKGLLGNPLGLCTNLWLIATAVSRGYALIGPPIDQPFLAAVNSQWSALPLSIRISAGLFAFLNLLVRIWCSAQSYGWRFAALAPLRQMLGNVLNSIALARAAGAFARSQWRGSRVAWTKTEHAYPVRPLEEVLCEGGWITRDQLKHAIACLPPDLGLGWHLNQLGMITAADLQAARRRQLGQRMPQKNRTSPPRCLPDWVAERWEIVPMSIEDGELCVASIELPKPGLDAEVQRQLHLNTRVVLVEPGQFERLKRDFRGARGAAG